MAEYIYWLNVSRFLIILSNFRLVPENAFTVLTDLRALARNVASNQQNNIRNIYCNCAMLPQSNEDSNMNGRLPIHK